MQRLTCQFVKPAPARLLSWAGTKTHQSLFRSLAGWSVLSYPHSLGPRLSNQSLTFGQLTFETHVLDLKKVCKFEKQLVSLKKKSQLKKTMNLEKVHEFKKVCEFEKKVHGF